MTAAAPDPWIVTAGEKVKHEEQFKNLSAGVGMVSGDAAKKFFLQSRLPPQVLGVIWSLSDINGDGKLDLYEFSIACKLINLKLRGLNLPPSLPPQLKQSACNAPAAAPPQRGLGGLLTGPIPTVPIVTPIPIQPLIGGMQPQMAASVAPQSVPMAAAIPAAQPSAVLAAAPPQAATMARTNSQESAGSGASAGAEWGVPQASKLKFTQVFNAIDRNKSGYLSGVQARNILVQSKLPNPMLAQIWALSDVDGDGQLSCEEFVLALYLCEVSKAGHALPSALPPHLIPPTQRKHSRSGIVISTDSGAVGSGELGSPTEALLRQNQLQQSSNMFAPQVNAPTNLSNIVAPTPITIGVGSPPTIPAQIMLTGQPNFEDKRRENFSKGQAELERRRKSLLDAQRRETEERMRKEREEATKKEKARQEAEKKRQEDVQAEMMRQKEAQEIREMESKKHEEQKEQARVDAEKQRQQEWEKQRLQELMNVRQRQQESLMTLKAQNQSLTIDLQTKDDRIKELTTKITDTRCAVTEVKATIDGMRSTRDDHMQGMNSLKQQARDQNQRLLIVNQERSQLKARSAAAASAGGGETPAVDAMVESKKVVVKQLKEKEEDLKQQMCNKEEDFNNNIITLRTVKEELRESVDRGKMLYDKFTEKRTEVLALREKLVNPDAAWGESSPPAATEAYSTTPAAVTAGAVGTCTQYRGLYQFEARNGDELSFMPGDIITVTSTEGADPGWYGGELNGQTGWFPEAYCEPVPEGEVVQHTPLSNIAEETPSFRIIGTGKALFSWSSQHNNQLAFTTGQKIVVREEQNGWMFGECGELSGWFPSNYIAMEGASSPPSSSSPPSPPDVPEYLAHDDISEFYTANYAYDSAEPGDLNFSVGSLILVVRREGDWWVGVMGPGNGVFPSNFVVRVDKQLSGTATVAPDAADTAAVIVVAAPAEEQVNETVAPPPASVAAVATGVSGVASDVEGASDAEAAAEVAATMAKATAADGQSKSGKKPEIAMVLAPYDATSANQLNLQRGQLVMIRKKTASGWWEGELQARGKKRQIGWFPASYVKALGGGSASARSTPVFQEATNILDAPPSASSESTPISTPVSNGAKNSASVTPTAPAAKTSELVEALYPYTAVNPDELTFTGGDIITVVDKEDAAWWKGELNGLEGVFPSNYVQPHGGVSTAAPSDGGTESFASQVSQIAAQAADFAVDNDDDNLC